MARKPSDDPFTGAMSDWELASTKTENADDSVGLSLSKPDRLAKEQHVVVEKYLGEDEGKRAPRPLGNPHADSVLEHSTLIRAKKKGSVDSDIDAKTMVVSNNKIIGVQG